MSLIYQCGDIKKEIAYKHASLDYHRVVAARGLRLDAEKVADFEQSNMNHTQAGDFTHLAPINTLSFRKSR